MFESRPPARLLIRLSGAGVRPLLGEMAGHTTKEAARTGEVVFSDTLKRHLRSGVSTPAPVALHPGDEEFAARRDESGNFHGTRLTHLEHRQ